MNIAVELVRIWFGHKLQKIQTIISRRHKDGNKNTLRDIMMDTFYIFVKTTECTTSIVNPGASLVAQWWRIHLPLQKTCVQILIQEDPTCLGATTPMHHIYWTWALAPGSYKYWSPRTLEPTLHNRRSHLNKKPKHWNERVAPAHCN